MAVMKIIAGGIMLCAVAGAGGYGGALLFIGKEARDEYHVEGGDSAPAVLNLGQFTIPVFEDDRVRGVLLAQINVETEGLQHMQSLSRNKAQIRSLVIDSFFAMEKEGLIAPDALSASGVAERLKKDLSMAFTDAKIRSVLIDRLLIQENGRANRAPS